MNRSYGDPVKVFDDKAATGISKLVYVKDYTNISLAIHGKSSPDLTIKLVGSTMEWTPGAYTAPDMTATQGEDNSWDFVQMIDLQNGATINGDTGLVFTGSADDRNLEANVNALIWVALRVTARAAGSVSAFITPFSI